MIKNKRLDLTQIKRERLATFPTPLTSVKAHHDLLGGINLFIKRDDLIDFGFGGNKVRGLEFLLADAKAKQADTLITGAGVLSNHVRATAAAASQAGLDMVAVYWGDEPESRQGNHLLTHILGADMHFTGSSDRTSVDRHMEVIAKELINAGHNPYIIPRGGACSLGVIGHIAAVEEVAAQFNELKTSPDRVILAVGSGGTLAGWILGCKILGLDWKVEGYTVSRPAKEIHTQVQTLITDTTKYLGIDVPISKQDIIIHDGVIGEGYGIPTFEGQAAIQLAARQQGIFFDPTYTGKAFGGFMKDVSFGKFSNVNNILFLHTGGAPTIFTSSGPISS